MAKILLVEDNELNRDMLSRRLQRKGHQVLLAADGLQAILMAESETPDLVLLDMSLPVIDGWEAARRLKSSPTTGARAGDRADRARDGRRPRARARGRLRRVRHEADRLPAAAREDRRAARAVPLSAAQARHGAATRGSRAVNTEPLPSALRTRISPPIISARRWLIARPSPVPP